MTKRFGRKSKQNIANFWSLSAKNYLKNAFVFICRNLLFSVDPFLITLARRCCKIVAVRLMGIETELNSFYIMLSRSKEFSTSSKKVNPSLALFLRTEFFHSSFYHANYLESFSLRQIVQTRPSALRTNFFRSYTKM